MLILTDIYILNTDYKIIGIVDNYSSAIFTRRYWEYGDFELYIKANNKSLSLLQPDFYIKRNNDTYIYVIESIQLTTSQEDGDLIIEMKIFLNHIPSVDLMLNILRILVKLLKIVFVMLLK